MKISEILENASILKLNGILFLRELILSKPECLKNITRSYNISLMKKPKQYG